MNIRLARPLSRRTLLRAAGVSLALPWLEAMEPLRASPLAPQASADQAGPTRTVFMFAPNGMYLPDWTPAEDGKLDQLSDLLQPLDAHKSDFSVLSNLANMESYRVRSSAMHAPGAGAFLTCTSPHKTRGGDVRSGISVDQMIAREIGTQTRLPSLELSVDTPTGTGQCDNDYNCVYTSTISWRSATAPVSRDISPRSVFERLFAAAGGDREARQRRSILDFVQAEARDLSRRVGTADRARMDQYLESVREIERRLQAFESDPPTPDAAIRQRGHLPIVPDDYGDYARLMIDLLVAALTTDSTRVGSLMLGVEISNRTYPEIGVNSSHHQTSHHGNDPKKLASYKAVNRYHLSFFAHLLERLKSIREGEATLLDRSQVMFGCCIGDGNRHNYDHLPVLLAGRGNGSLRPGFHRRYADKTPIANLYLAMLAQSGISLPRFADSTGSLADLT